MTTFFCSLILTAVMAIPSAAGTASITLKDGVVSYSDPNAGRSTVQVGGPCADLWVSPDGQEIAFIRIDRSRPNPYAIEPFIEQSTIFVASRSAGFKPVRVDFEPPEVDGRHWNVFRTPRVSPDLHTVYFLIPAAGTSWFLMSAPISGGPAKPITWVEDYCVIWGGVHPGDLLAVIRGEPPDAARGVAHLYYHYSASGAEELIGNRESSGGFEDVARAWTHKYGGACEQNTN